MPANTLKVDRATKWGNPFHQKDYEGREGAVEAYRTWMHGDSKDAAKVRAAAREELRGKNLGCWCPLDGPCHGDVLLEIANR